MKVKTSELIGPALDWAVAKCEGLPLKLDPMDFRGEAPEAVQSGWWVWPGPCAMIIGYTPVSPNDCRGYSPSTDWAQGGPIIYRGDISVLPPTVRRIGAERHAFPVDYWRAMVRKDENENAIHGKGPTPLIAAMRCYVATKLGDEVDVPEELA